jgi:hypothetical protein
VVLEVGVHEPESFTIKVVIVAVLALISVYVVDIINNKSKVQNVSI